MSVTRRDFSKLLACAVLAPAAEGMDASPAIAGGVAPSRARLETFNLDGVRLLDGRLKQQFQATRDTYYNIPNDSFLFGFRKRAGLPAPGKGLDGWYGSDIFNAFGQYLSGMARMAKVANDNPLRDKTIFLMREWARTIGPNGYFFYSKQPNFQHYFYEKMMGGLNDIYEYLGEKEALVYIDRITDWAIANLDRSRPNPGPTPPGVYTGDAGEWYTLSENLYRAYLNTGDPKYRTFAEVWHYSKYWDGYAQGHPQVAYLHAYSHVNTLSSAAMAYEVSGDPIFLKTIVNAYDYLKRTQWLVTGGYGPSERLRPPDGSLGDALETDTGTFETPCGSWAAFKLGRYLIRFTGEARYGDWIELLTYNGIGAALPMKETGKTFYNSDYRVCGSAKVYYSQDWPCCSGTYPEAVSDYHNTIYFKDHAALYINLFVPSEVSWRHDGQDIVLRQETDYPESEKILLTVTPQERVKFPLKFRVPEWANRGVAVKINGGRENVDARPGAWATIRRSWSRGDKVEISIPLEFRLAPVDMQHPKRVSVIRGPLVLVRQGQPPISTNFSQWKQEESGPLAFDVNSQPESRLVPFYRLNLGQPYSMYFDLSSPVRPV